MRTICFPACGFGFWYMLPKALIIIEKKEKFNYIGVSSGSLLCIVTLLKKEFQNYNSIMTMAKSVKDKISKVINLHEINSIFIDELFKCIDKKNLAKNLRRIKIQVTKIETLFIIPVLKKELLQPRNLVELKQMCLASSYIPLLSRHSPFFSLQMNDSYYIDGKFSNIFTKEDNDENMLYLKVKENLPITKIPTENVARCVFYKSYAEGIDV